MAQVQPPWAERVQVMVAPETLGAELPPKVAENDAVPPMLMDVG